LRFKEALSRAAALLQEKGIHCPRLEGEVLLSWASHFTRPMLLARLEEEMPPPVHFRFWPALRRRLQGCPLQYTIGYQEFMGLKFKVSPGVFIPRQDTEVLVEALLDRLDPGRKWVIADCGTGSGAIGLSLAHHLSQAVILATDVSPKALAVARENARLLGLLSRVIFLAGPYLKPLKGYKVDVLVANPPYISQEELASLPPEVRWEPLLALSGGEDGLEAYRHLIPEAPKVLKPGGLMALEIGHLQGEKVIDLIRSSSSYQDPVLLRDHGGRERAVLALVKHSLQRG